MLKVYLDLRIYLLMNIKRVKEKLFHFIYAKLLYPTEVTFQKFNIYSNLSQMLN